jgi:hypothetical protein
MVAGSDRRNWRPRRDHHAGAAALRLLIDRTGLTAGLSRALARRGFQPVHNRGRVLADAAVLITEGGRVLSDFANVCSMSSARFCSKQARVLACSRSLRSLSVWAAVLSVSGTFMSHVCLG